MRLSISVVTVMLGSAAVTIASPITSAPFIRRDDDEIGAQVAAIGNCPTDCWNEAAVVADCDPNADDDCLCGPFFDAVTTCTSQTCNVGDNLAALSFLTPACQ
ncbi:hypothetical protein ACN47E_006947 [Coniothyrium glycines]